MHKVVAYAHGRAAGNPGPAGIGVHVTDSEGVMLEELSRSVGNGTEDFAVYQAVLEALQVLGKRFANALDTIEIEVWLNSEYVKKQLAGETPVTEPGYVPHFIEIHNLCVANFPRITFNYTVEGKDDPAAKLATNALI